jgi:hypothetical protein
MLAFLNVFFFVFHTAFMLFNLFGWIWKRTRKWNLYSILLTYSSWFILGIWYGWGYCLCTDYHWDIRRQMGIVDHSDSYTHFLILKTTGLNLNQELVDYMTLGALVAATVISIVLNIRDWKRKRVA